MTFVERGYCEGRRRGKRLDLAGKSFGLLTVVRHVGFNGDMSVWLCRCICGKEVLRRGAFLTFAKNHPHDRHYTSLLHCGCASMYFDRKNSDRKALRLWRSLRQRKKLCEQWHDDFGAFYEQCWKAKSDKWLVRIDQSKPLGPGNFRWSKHQEAWWATANLVAAYLIEKQGHTEQQAWDRINSISRERLRQLANTALGQCRFCSATPGVGLTSTCDRCAAMQAEKQRKHNERKRKANAG